MKPPPSPPPRLGCSLEAPEPICKGPAKAGTTITQERSTGKQIHRMTLNSLLYACADPDLPMRRVQSRRDCLVNFFNQAAAAWLFAHCSSRYGLFYVNSAPLWLIVLATGLPADTTAGDERHIKPQRLI
jgi:hypothetical protein